MEQADETPELPSQTPSAVGKPLPQTTPPPPPKKSLSKAESPLTIHQTDDVEMTDATPTKAPISEVQRAYLQVFGGPGRHRLVETDEDGLCGLHAIRSTLERLNAQPETTSPIPIPSLQELQDIVDSPDYRNTLASPWTADNASDVGLREEILYKERLANRDWFSPQQLDLMIRIWGTSHKRNLRLGLLFDSDDPWMFGNDDSGYETIFIHFRPITKYRGHYRGLERMVDSEAKHQDESKSVPDYETQEIINEILATYDDKALLATLAYRLAFPSKGNEEEIEEEYEVLKNPGGLSGLLAGLGALMNSLRSQRVGMETLGNADMLQVFKHPKFRQYMGVKGDCKAFMRKTPCTPERVDRLLKLWGLTRQPPVNLRLGWIEAGTPHLAARKDNDILGADVITIWVQFADGEVNGIKRSDENDGTASK